MTINNKTHTCTVYRNKNSKRNKVHLLSTFIPSVAHLKVNIQILLEKKTLFFIPYLIKQDLRAQYSSLNHGRTFNLELQMKMLSCLTDIFNALTTSIQTVKASFNTKSGTLASLKEII